MPIIYQTFEDQKGSSPSIDKLPLLQIPENLLGKYVLDMGCNEGFFSFECERRGAMVTGIDSNKLWIDRAEARNTQNNVDFQCMDWEHFLDTTPLKFDLILFTSAFHYILGRQEEILEKIKNVMAPDGLLILEVGIAGEYKRIIRVSDGATVEYPTMWLLGKWLTRRSMDYKYINNGINLKGDDVQRYIFHCKKIKTTTINQDTCQKTKSRVSEPRKQKSRQS